MCKISFYRNLHLAAANPVEVVHEGEEPRKRKDIDQSPSPNIGKIIENLKRRKVHYHLGIFQQPRATSKPMNTFIIAVTSMTTMMSPSAHPRQPRFHNRNERLSKRCRLRPVHPVRLLVILVDRFLIKCQRNLVWILVYRSSFYTIIFLLPLISED